MATQAAARQPVSSAPGAKLKILRIGIIQGGRIVEERLVRKRENITIGQSAKNMFVVLSDALPRNWLLFEASGTGYVGALLRRDGRAHRGRQRDHLAVAAEADGQDPEAGRRVGAAARRAGARKDHARRHDDPVPVRHAAAAAAAAAAAGVGARIGAVRHRLVLHDRRGRVVPAAPRLRHLPAQRRLAAQARHRGGSRSLRPDGGEEGGEEAGAEEGRGREGRRDKKEEKKKGEEEKKQAPKKELSEEEKAKIAEAKAKADAERRARLAEQVKSTGLLKLLGAKSDGGGSIADVLGKGDVDRDQEKAFQGVGGVGVASGNDSLRGIKSGGSGSGRVADAGSLRGGAGIAGAETGKGAGERTVKAAIKTETPAVDGELDPNMVAKEVRSAPRRHQGLLRARPEAQPEPVGQGRHSLDDHAGRHRVGRGRRAGHARRRRGRQLHQVA